MLSLGVLVPRLMFDRNECAATSLNCCLRNMSALGVLRTLPMGEFGVDRVTVGCAAESPGTCTCSGGGGGGRCCASRGTLVPTIAELLVDLLAAAAAAAADAAADAAGDGFIHRDMNDSVALPLLSPPPLTSAPSLFVRPYVVAIRGRYTHLRKRCSGLPSTWPRNGTCRRSRRGSWACRYVGRGDGAQLTRAALERGQEHAV